MEKLGRWGANDLVIPNHGQFLEIIKTLKIAIDYWPTKIYNYM